MAKEPEDKFTFATEQHMRVDSPTAPDGGANGAKIIAAIKAKGGKIRDLDTHVVYATQDRTLLQRIAGKDPLQPVPREKILAGLTASMENNESSLKKLDALLDTVLQAAKPIVLAFDKASEEGLKKQFNNPAAADKLKREEPKVYQLARKQLHEQMGEKDPSYEQLNKLNDAYVRLRTASKAAKEVLAGQQSDPEKFKYIIRRWTEMETAVKQLSITANKQSDTLPQFLEPQIKNLLSLNSLLAKEKQNPTMQPQDFSNIRNYADQGTWETREMLKVERAADAAKQGPAKA